MKNATANSCSLQALWKHFPLLWTVNVHYIREIQSSFLKIILQTLPQIFILTCKASTVSYFDDLVLLEHLNLVISQLFEEDMETWIWKYRIAQIFHTPSKDRARKTETYSVGGERGTWVHFMRGSSTRFINSVFYNYNFSISCVLIGLFLYHQ